MTAQPLLPMLAREEVDEPVRRLLDAATQRGYQDPNFLRVLAHDPPLLQHLLAFTKYFMYEGEVEHRLIELVRLKLAQLNACHF
ncbi:MAG: hypothetical protein KatS3mg131_0957 [Candidatus Tectimicrobiota bacterium]|nr:MAG: hypothetical protein KatS3mg131_0957 [Candidatus Tectomicrobia bacterium]